MRLTVPARWVIASWLMAGGAVLLAYSAGRAPDRELRVCSDPNNLPFSNQRRQGFENRLAELLASELHARVRYTWWPQRRGFIRETLNAGLCDVLMGVPSDFEPALPTAPYYRSTYVFVSRAGAGFDVRSLNDPRLRSARIGVHLIGDDYINTPPAHALASRNIVDNVVGFPIYGDYAEANPPARIIEAVAAGTIDVAIVWGPFAGYFGPRQRVPLRIAPVLPQRDRHDLPFVFEISLAVRRGDEGLRRELEAALHRRQKEVERLLERYGVPRVRESPAKQSPGIPGALASRGERQPR